MLELQGTAGRTQSRGNCRLRAGETVDGKVGWAIRALKAATRTWLFPLSEVGELALSTGGPDLIENHPSICCVENRQGGCGLQMGGG